MVEGHYPPSSGTLRPHLPGRAVVGPFERTASKGLGVTTNDAALGQSVREASGTKVCARSSAVDASQA
jgi:hypothetical protein